MPDYQPGDQVEPGLRTTDEGTKRTMPGSSGRKTKGYGVGLFSHEASGPLHPGAEIDQHIFAVTPDGLHVNAGHLDTNSYFIDTPDFDAPLDFEQAYYPYPGGFPLKSKVHLVMDLEERHPFVGGNDGIGKWRWFAEVPEMIVPKPRPPPPTTPGEPGPPPSGGPPPPSGPVTPGEPATPTTPGGGTTPSGDGEGEENKEKPPPANETPATPGDVDVENGGAIQDPPKHEPPPGEHNRSKYDDFDFDDYGNATPKKKPSPTGGAPAAGGPNAGGNGGAAGGANAGGASGGNAGGTGGTGVNYGPIRGPMAPNGTEFSPEWVVRRGVIYWWNGSDYRAGGSGWEKHKAWERRVKGDSRTASSAQQDE